MPCTYYYDCLQTNIHAELRLLYIIRKQVYHIIFHTRTLFIQFVNMSLLEKGNFLEFAEKQMQYPLSWVLLLLPTFIYFVRKWIKGPTKGMNIYKAMLGNNIAQQYKINFCEF